LRQSYSHSQISLRRINWYCWRLKKERKVRAHRAAYVNDSESYINEHHRLCALKQTYPDCSHSKAYFSDDAWSAWGENKTFSLPETQACLLKMGINVKI
jgi:hypothetical protein